MAALLESRAGAGAAALAAGAAAFALASFCGHKVLHHCTVNLNNLSKVYCSAALIELRKLTTKALITGSLVVLQASRWNKK